MADLQQARDLIRHAQRRHQRVTENLRGLNVPYYRRGELSIPAFKMKPGGDPESDGRATSMKIMRKAAELPVDFFFYDLEDAAPDNPEFKPLARSFIVDAFSELDYGDRVRAFRPNNIRTPYFEDDICEVVGKIGYKLDAIVLPKTETADEVKDVQNILRHVQRLSGFNNRIAIEVLIESPRAFRQADQIAAFEDVTALIFGSWDFARTIGGRVEPQTWLQDQGAARQLLPIIAAAYGKDAVDAVTATLPIRPKDPNDHAAVKKHAVAVELARQDAMNARRVGFAAKWILHPDQIEAIQGAWTPNRETAMAALQLAADYTRAAQMGSGAEVHGDQLADKAVVGTEWWVVRAALHAGILNDTDLKRTGYTIQQLERTVRTRD
jgi:citrate lyase subunit beta/citryl-CoA lyase